MKKLALTLCILMLLSMMACTNQKPGTNNPGGTTTPGTTPGTPPEIQMLEKSRH